MSRISTHVLDTTAGRPVADIRVRLFRDQTEVAAIKTNADGRCPSLLPSEVGLVRGTYGLVFEIGDYFRNGFYPEVRISFLVRDETADYHVPLLISPFGYTTYRGS